MDTTQIDLNLNKNTNILKLKCLGMMILIYIKQHVNNICSSIHEKVKWHWGWVRNGGAYKKACASYDSLESKQ